MSSTTLFPWTFSPALSTSWPRGTYGLMKSAFGCPYGNWSEGFRKQDTEDISPTNDFSPLIEHFLAGEFGRDIQTEFCMKTEVEDLGEDWPTGTYCILKKGDCPTGLSPGYIFWDDEDLFNANDKGGVLPDGEYDRNTKIYYCCRNDSDPNNEIELPTNAPFVLIRYGATCQSVSYMPVTDVFVRWDDDDWFHARDSGGMHPLDEGGNKNHKLHFCYYYYDDLLPVIG